MQFLQSTVKGTPGCSSHSGTALHETYVASQEVSGRYCDRSYHVCSCCRVSSEVLLVAVATVVLRYMRPM